MCIARTPSTETRGVRQQEVEDKNGAHKTAPGSLRYMLKDSVLYLSGGDGTAL